ncbi:MAG: hypothetical protein H7A34_04260 [bacterium]|nr:hypothetical protein [bacterium]
MFLTDDADLIVVAYGTPARMAKSAITKLRGQGVKVGLFRPITLWPYPEKNYSAWQNMHRIFLS